MILFGNYNYKDRICTLKKYDGQKWNYEGILIGSETPLYKFIIRFMKMNLINCNIKKKGTNIDELLNAE